VEILTLIKKLPADKLTEYDECPLAHRAGLIHSISEETLSIDTATIIDVNFLGLFPKSLLHVLRQYKNRLKGDLQAEFDKLITSLLSAFIYRAITIQRIIQYLLAAIKLQIETDCAQRQQTLDANDGEQESRTSLHTSAAKSTTTQVNNNSIPPKLCHANKCRILLAKGILRTSIPCAKGRNMCPGCIIEGTRQRKTATAEIEILEANTPNHILATILDYTTTAVSIKKLRQSLQHLPTMNYTKHDDSIFGVVRYLANSLGLRLNNATAGSIDEPMTLVQVKQQWRQATFSCKCRHIDIEQKIYGDRAFCDTCSFIIPHCNPPPKRCPGCLLQDSWGPTGSSCLACQFATIIYRNRFHTRYIKYSEQWLPTLATDSEDDTVDPPAQHHRSTYRTPESHE
jgi:hypothetical protein